MHNNKGFGLLEVLVASVILVSLLAAIMPLFDMGLKQTKKAEQVALMLSSQKRIYQHLSIINPAKETTGDGVDNDWSYRWKTSRISDYELQYAPESISQNKLALFKVTVDMALSEDALNNNQNTHHFAFNLIGWQDETQNK
ncbi:type II secretion system protein [Photobacterium leiognathi]|uniref:type II secretion system protein n=1 Tax=Photobacterium leiognathi TaxID=553611 RepID=UPI00298189C7|nr:prepilin-type N-terminal cleavage/methylation domain-containing protein [Photobacterium leiognathi]